MRVTTGVLFVISVALATLTSCNSSDLQLQEGDSCTLGGKSCATGLQCLDGICTDQTKIRKLTITIVGSGTVEIPNRTACNPTCDFGLGKSVSLTAKPAAGSTFVGWSGDCTGSSLTTSLVIDANKACTATFRTADQTAYMVTAGAQTGGSISATGAGLTCSNGSCTGRVATNTQVTITATASSGYRFDGWTGTGGCEGTTSPLTITVNTEVQCTAKFVQVFPVSVSATGGPAAVTVTAGSCTSTSCMADKNSDVVFVAQELAGYRFDEWQGDALCAGKNPTLTVRVTEAVSCVASYVKRFTVAGVVGGGLPGTITATSATTSVCSGASCVTDAGVAVTLVASTIPGYRVSDWTGTGCDAGVRSGNGITIKPTADTTCTAVYTPGVAVAGAVVGAEGTVTAEATGTGVSCGSGQCSLDAGGSVTLTAPNLEPGFRFTGWTGDAGCTGTSLTLTLGNVQTSVSCNAGYVRRLKVTGAIEPGHDGVAATATSDAPFKSCSGSTCTVDEKQTVTLTAPVLSGYRLVRWLGAGCEGTDHIITVEAVGEDITCTADYATAVTVRGDIAGATGDTVTAESTSDGHACFANSCTIDTGGSVTLTAPDLSPGFRFTSWSGDAGCTGITRAITLTDVTSSRVCVASYVTRVTVATGVATDGGSVELTPEDPTAACDGKGSCVVDEGTNIELDVTAPAGYRFDKWTGGAACEGKTDDPLTIAAAEVTCTALFVQQFTVTVASQGTTAPVKVTFGSCSGTSCPVDKDGVALLEVTDSPSDGFRFREWGGDCSGTETAIRVQVTKPLTCTAVFVARYTITAVAPPSADPPTLKPGGGAADCDADSCTTDAGSQVTLTAGSWPGKAFSKWSGAGCTGTTQGNAITVTVNADVTCTAEYVDGVSVSGTMEGTDGTGVVTAEMASGVGVCDSSGKCTLEPGGSVKLTAPNMLPGYRFISWGGDAACGTGTTMAITLGTVQSSISCKAIYVKRVTISGVSDPTGATMTVTSSGVTCSGASCVVDLNATVNVGITVPSGRRLTAWTGTGCTPITAPPMGTVPNPIVIKATGDITCTAKHALTVKVSSKATPAGASPTLTAASTSPGHDCSAGACTLDAGGDVTVSTTSLSPSYRFKSWSGTGCGTSTSLSTVVTNVTEDRTCSADYVKRHHLTGAVSIGGGGTVGAVTITGGTNLDCGATGSADDCYTDAGGSAVKFTAASASGYRFVGWSGCSTSTSAEISITPAADVACTASYSRQQTVTVSADANGTAKVEINSGTGSCNMTNSSCTADHDATFKFTATADAHYDFDKWRNTNCTPVGDNPLVPTGAVTSCAVSFKKEIYTVTGAVKPTKVPAAGQVRVSYSTCSDQASCSVPYNDSATVTASANAGYEFEKWENCGGSADKQITVKPSADTTCTAIFRLLVIGTTNAGTIAGTPGPAGGTCTGNGTGTTSCAIPDNGSVSFTVTVPSGYTLTGWSGPCTANGNSAVYNPVTAPGSCSASYFGRWARSFGLKDSSEDTVGLLKNPTKDVVYLVGDTQFEKSPQQPLAMLIDGMPGRVDRAARLASPEAFAGAISAAWNGGPLIAAAGPGNAPSVTQLNESLSLVKSWALTYPMPTTVALRIFVAGGALGARAWGVYENAQLKQKAGRLQFLENGAAVDICESSRASCAPNGACVTTCEASCFINSVGPMIEVGGGDMVVAFPGRQTTPGTVVVTLLKGGMDPVWTLKAGFEGATLEPMAMATRGSELLVVGKSTNAQGITDGFVVRIDMAKPAIVDAFTWGTGGAEHFTAVSVDSKGRYLVTGTIAEPAAPAGIPDIWLVRTSPDFKTSVEQFAYGGASTEQGVGAAELASGDVVLAGQTTSFGALGDHWAMLLDPEKLNITFNAGSGAHRKTVTAGVLAAGFNITPECVYAKRVDQSLPAIDVKAEPVDTVFTQQAPGP